MKKLMIFGLSALAGTAFGAGVVRKIYQDKMKKIQSGLERYQTLFLMMNQWVKINQERKRVASYFEKNGYKKISVYGVGYAGETLIDELKGSGIDIAYAIDKRADSMYSDTMSAGVKIVSVSDDLEPVDAVVVTAITYFNEIEEMLSGKVDCPILSLEDILYEA